MKSIYNFGHKLSFIYIISIVCPFLLVAIVSSLFFYRTYQHDTYELNSALLTSTANNVETYLKELNSLTTAPYAYEELMNYMIEMGKTDSEIDAYHKYKMEQQYIQSISKILYLNHDDILSIIYIPFTSKHVSSDSAVVLSKGISDAAPLEEAILANDAWQEAVMAKNGSSYFSYADDLTYDDSPLLSNNLFFSASRLLQDGISKKPVGIFRVDVYDVNLQKIFQNLDMGSGGNLVLLDEAGHIIYSAREVTDNILQKLKDKPERLNDDASYTAQYYELPSANWTLVSLSSEKDLNQISSTIMLFFAVITVVFVIISLVSYRSSSRSMVRTINQLLHVLENVEKGDLSTKVTVKGNDQLAIIGEAINRMVDRLEEHINREYVSVIRRKEMEYLALQSQINPHFLYNVMNSISIMNTMGEKVMVQETISNLTKLMRYSCIPEKDSTLSKECDFLEQYLQLQSIRFSDRLKYKINITEECQMCIIPKFLLQPLVENSIVHGMEPYDIQVMITVEAFLSNDMLHIKINDNGIGFHFDDTACRENVGLGNVRSRLLLFDPDSTFTIKSSEEAGTEVTMVLHAKYK